MKVLAILQNNLCKISYNDTKTLSHAQTLGFVEKITLKSQRKHEMNNIYLRLSFKDVNQTYLMKVSCRKCKTLEITKKFC